jgi:predicted metal-dependent peptidase
VVQAAVAAKARGNLPLGAERLVGQVSKPKVDWASALRRFAQEVARADYSWCRPNTRYMPSGIYLPALLGHEVGILAVGVDTSGSIDQTLLSQFESEVRAIVDDVRPREVRVLYCDAKVHRQETFERGDPVQLKAAGGGGTDFRPVFDTIARWDEQPVCVIYLTDLWGAFPSEEPEVPVMWVTGQDDREDAPFGEVVAAL